MGFMDNAVRAAGRMYEDVASPLVDSMFSSGSHPFGAPRGEIYRIWFDNDSSGKCYVGQTVQGINKRKRQHIQDAQRNDGAGCPLLDEATRQFGAFHMMVETLETGIETQAELDEAERFWISQYASQTPNGYNVKSGGQRNQGAAASTVSTAYPSVLHELSGGMLAAAALGLEVFGKSSNSKQASRTLRTLNGLLRR